MPKPDGGPAFPSPPHILKFEGREDLTYAPEGGMTLRDWFAGQALQGLIVNPATLSVAAPLSARAYEIADAMLAEREK